MKTTLCAIPTSRAERIKGVLIPEVSTFLETNLSTPFGYKAPVNPRLTYTASLANLNTLFAGDDVFDNVGHRANIAPAIFYGKNTVDKLQIYSEEPQWMADPVKRLGIENKTWDLLFHYRFVVMGTEVMGYDQHYIRALKRVLLRSPYPAHHELISLGTPKRAAAEHWRFRSGLLSSDQAHALCLHLNSFRRTDAHGRVIDWSVCEGPAPDADLGNWLRERSGYAEQLHRSMDDLRGFGIDSKLGSRIACFKLCAKGRFEGNFSYLPAAPVIEPLYRINCQSRNVGLAPAGHVSVTLGQRDCKVGSRTREEILEYADYAGAYPELPVSDTGLHDAIYHFLSDEEYTGAPLGPEQPRPHEHAARLFTTSETLLVMKYLHKLGFHRIRRVQDLKACTSFPSTCRNYDDGVMRYHEHRIPELGLTLYMECFVPFETDND
jgi:hypothetical protein